MTNENQTGSGDAEYMISRTWVSASMERNPFMNITGQDKNSFGSSSQENLAMIICPQNTNEITMVTAILVSVYYLLVAPLDPTSLARCTVDQQKSLDPVRIRQLRHSATQKQPVYKLIYIK